MTTPLDNQLIPYEKVSFDSKIGAIANPQAQGFAWPLMFFGIICIGMLKPGSIVLGSILFLLSSFIVFSYRGIEFDIDKNMYKEYSKYFGLLKSGDWQSAEPFPFVSVLSKQMANQLKFGLTFRYRDFGIYLLSDDHRTRIQIASADDEISALQTAKIICSKVNKQYQVYNPPKRAGRSSRRHR